MTLPRAERLALVEREASELSLKTQAELLSLSRSSLYYQPVPVSAEEVALKHAIDEIYTRYPFYGSRRVTVELRQNRQFKVARETVQRYMREMGTLAPHCKCRCRWHLSRAKSEPPQRCAQGLSVSVAERHSRPSHHVWGVDITYIRLRNGWMYLVAVLDWFSRYVVSWELDQTLEMPFVVATVQRALAQATPVIWNSDQGSHFTSPQYTQLLLNAGVQISMDGKGRALDNIFTERLWRSVKYEEVYLNDYANPKEARRGLAEYLHFYDYHRPHQALNYQTPAAIYYGHTGDRAACIPVVTSNDVRM